MTGRELFNRNKVLFKIFIRVFKLIPKALRVFIWDTFSNFSQLPFEGIRYVILLSLIKRGGENIRIGTNVRILGWKNLIIGSNVSIHSNCYIDASGNIEIGDNVSIAHSSSILSSNHSWQMEDIPIKYNTLLYEKVKICDDVWIGCGCRVLAGVLIESRAIIAAGAIVANTVKHRTIVGGVPARIIKVI